ncbi:MAG: carboxypeptidase regulatory-like domain-containing protein [Chitinispirillaceae bacterium]|nr:carboxypeptidase regulatory-like domain-containing protein [Chitinispirillaceae bacterium]
MVFKKPLMFLQLRDPVLRPEYFPIGTAEDGLHEGFAEIDVNVPEQVRIIITFYQEECMYLKIAVCLALLTVFHTEAQTIALSGKVTDPNGKAIQRAVVQLKSRNLSDTTDTGGAYLLSAEASAINDAVFSQNAPFITLKSGILFVNHQKKEPVRMEIFDIQGKLIETVTGSPKTTSVFRYNLVKHVARTGMMIIRVNSGQKTSCLRIIPSTIYTCVSAVTSEVNKLQKQSATIDKLDVSAAGYVSKSVSISSYRQTLDIPLEAESPGECTQSRPVNTTVSGSGPHKVVIETNSDPGINKGTIFRPEDLAPGKNYPIFVWGEGGCSQNGLSNKAAMGEIASWGYFIIADGTPGGGGGGLSKASSSGMGNPEAFYNYITWAIAENRKPCSAYYQSLDTSKIAADGFSCGGLMAINASGDPRFAAIGYTSSGLFSADQTLYKKIHTPIKIMNGGSSDMAYENGLRDFEDMSALGIAVLYFSKTSAGHGGDLNNGKGDFNTVNLAWLNWQLKGDEGSTGKALLIGPNCKFCKASGWEFKSNKLQ